MITSLRKLLSVWIFVLAFSKPVLASEESESRDPEEQQVALIKSPEAKCCHLEILYLSGCWIDNQRLRYIARFLRGVIPIKALNISDNPFDWRGLNCLVMALCTNEYLEDLTLDERFRCWWNYHSHGKFSVAATLRNKALQVYWYDRDRKCCDLDTKFNPEMNSELVLTKEFDALCAEGQKRLRDGIEKTLNHVVMEQVVSYLDSRQYLRYAPLPAVQSRKVILDFGKGNGFMTWNPYDRTWRCPSKLEFIFLLLNRLFSTREEMGLFFEVQDLLVDASTECVFHDRPSDGGCGECVRLEYSSQRSARQMRLSYLECVFPDEFGYCDCVYHGIEERNYIAEFSIVFPTEL